MNTKAINKNSNEKPEIVFIDFDGVISRNSILDNFKSAHQYINQYTPIPFEFLFNFLKSTTAFSLQSTLDFLFTSLGISDIPKSKQEELIKNLYKKEIVIDDDFFPFLDLCDNHSIRYIIFSSAGNNIKEMSVLTKRIDKKNIFNLNGRSKANVNTYHDAAEELRIDFKKCLCIDDTPLVLQIAKLQGMRTAMMLNNVFTLNDYQIFSSFIDYKINSFLDLGVILNELSSGK